MKKIEDYKAIDKFPVLEGYLHHFANTSMMNDIPGMLSFFFIQGQLLLPYVRIPTGDNHLDPRVHVFWIQPSRTGKSIAWNFISEIMQEIGVDYEAFASGTDAGLIGSNKPVFDENNKPTGDTEIVPGLLAGKKAINFDEGSILLTPNKHSQETVLYLQTACNAVGSKSNILVKHLKGDKIECESKVSLWITTYPPSGVKEYVLTKGIFQRVLLYWKHWDMDMRQEVSNTRLGTFFQRPNDNEVSKEDICEYFKTTEIRIRDRLFELSETTFTQWHSMSDEDKEDIVQQYMWDMFTPSADYQTALYQASDDIYENLGQMSASMAEIVASFTPGIENYLGIISLHMAVLDESWEITEDHVDMAFDILNDLFMNLIQWLEDSVQIDSNKKKENKILEELTTALNASADFELDKYGGGWRRKLNVKSMYMESTGVSKATAERHLKDYSMKIFEKRKQAQRVYYRLKGNKA